MIVSAAFVTPSNADRQQSCNGVAAFSWIRAMDTSSGWMQCSQPRAANKRARTSYSKRGSIRGTQMVWNP